MFDHNTVLPISPTLSLVPHFGEADEAFSFVLSLYRKSFPREERRCETEFCDLLLSDPRFKLFLILWKERLAGFLSGWVFEDFLFGEHFAISPQLRGGGIGRELIEFLWKKPLVKPWIFEVEPPVSDIALRRLEFYRSLGAEILTREYFQPPYRHGEAPFPLYLMGVGEDLPPMEESIQKIHAIVYKQKDFPPPDGRLFREKGVNL